MRTQDGHILQLYFVLYFLRHFPSLVENGHVYVAMLPLYRIDIGKDEVHYALDEAGKRGDLARLAKKKGKPNGRKCFKGLGEMNPSQLRETTMDPSTRRLIQLLSEEAKTEAETLQYDWSTICQLAKKEQKIVNNGQTGMKRS